MSSPAGDSRPWVGELTEFDLGHRGLEHVKRSLEGGLDLARLIPGLVDLTQGRCFTFLPPSTPPERRFSFLEGGLVRGVAASSVFSTLVLGALLSARYGLLVAENALARCGDPVLDGEPAERFCVGNDVYEYVTAEAATRDAIKRAFRTADAGYTLNAIVTTPTRRVSLPRSRAIASGTVLGEVAEHTALVLTRAYDGEGFVVWVPR
ncbi:MAG: hypothetical protein U9R47_04465 [Actinomycetota bacterium]|nr:hypothetical protein [Actinomycetota bacterium]